MQRTNWSRKLSQNSKEGLQQEKHVGISLVIHFYKFSSIINVAFAKAQIKDVFVIILYTTWKVDGATTHVLLYHGSLQIATCAIYFHHIAGSKLGGCNQICRETSSLTFAIKQESRELLKDHSLKEVNLRHPCVESRPLRPMASYILKGIFQVSFSFLRLSDNLWIWGVDPNPCTAFIHP